MLITFWGVRGSISAPGPDTIRYGGNTPCVEVVTSSGASVIIDAGYGVVGLGEHLMATPGRAREVHLILTHLHWDHIQGLPFFVPIYIPGNRLIIHSASAETARQAMDRLFTSVYSPIMGVDNLGAKIEYVELGESLQLGGAEIRRFPVRHSVPTLGICVSDGGKLLVHATDHEGGTAAADARLIEAARGADLLVHDTQFTGEEYEQYRGWGHSSTEAATANALAAGVRHLAIFHYEATHSDAHVDAQLRRAQELADGRLQVSAAAERTSITL